MISIKKERLPKVYERPVIEEYYRFFTELEGFRPIINRHLRWTIDENKQRLIDKSSNYLQRAIEAYKSVDREDVELICYEEDDFITAIGRIIVKPEYIHIADIIHLDYPTDYERENNIVRIIDAAQHYALETGCNSLSIEVPKTDEQLVNVAVSLGLFIPPEQEKYVGRYLAYYLEKDLKREYGQTRSRKQTEEYDK